MIERDSNHLQLIMECGCCFIRFKTTVYGADSTDKLGIEVMMRDEDMKASEAAELVLFYEEAKALRDYLNDMMASADQKEDHK